MFEYKFSLFLVWTTIFLIVFGGVVHNTESGLACPDWPLCYGELLPDKEGGVGIEMGHRMVAAGVGLLTIFLSISVIVRKRFAQKYQRYTLISVSLVIFQGALGALTVLLRLPSFASTAHLAVSILFLSLLITLTCQAKLSTLPVPFPMAQEKAGRVIKWIGLLVIAIYLQMLLGAFVRHTGSGAAAGIGPGAAFIGIDPTSGKHALWPLEIPGKLNMLHRYFAVAVGLFTLLMGLEINRLAGELEDNWLRVIAYSSIILVIAQISLGVLSVYSFLGIITVTAHLAAGTLLYSILFGGYLYLKFLKDPYNYRLPAEAEDFIQPAVRPGYPGSGYSQVMGQYDSN
jgi:heme A synthase